MLREHVKFNVENEGVSSNILHLEGGWLISIVS